MSTQAAVTEASAALREFLSEHLGAEEMRQASKLIAAYVAAAVNDRPRVIRERQEAEARREQAIQDAKDHHRQTTGSNPFTRKETWQPSDGLMDSLDRLTELTAEMKAYRGHNQPTQGKA